MSKFKRFFSIKRMPLNNKRESGDKSISLPPDIEGKMQMLQAYIKDSRDIIVRSFHLGSHQFTKAVIIYMEGVIDTQFLNEDIIKPLMTQRKAGEPMEDVNKGLLKQIKNRLISVGQIQKQNKLMETVQSIFDGHVVLLIDNVSKVLVMNIHGGATRALDEPLTDKTICGPREGFIEDLTTNIALIRRKLRDPNLAVEKMIIGKRTRTDVAILYIKDIAKDEIIDKVRERLKSINIDGILSIGQINQLIEDNPNSTFPFYREIERADIAVAELLEGRAVIIANQSPLAVCYPAIFEEMLQAAEDYYSKPQIGTMTRIIRYIAFFSAVSLPALYISIISFRQELIPYDLLVPIAKARSEVPFPAVFEVLILDIIIYIIYEAGLRMPGNIGQTIGVVAGIILGQAIISASLASPAVIIVITITAISTFSIPNTCMVFTVRYLRIGFIIAAATFGIFGFSIAWLFLIMHLIYQESMGVPYFAPYGPLILSDLKDSLAHKWIFDFRKRPESIPNNNPVRQSKMKRIFRNDKSNKI